MAEKFEDKMEDFNPLEFKELEELTQFFKLSVKFLQDYRLSQVRGDLAEKTRLAKLVSRFKEILLSMSDRIEERVKMSEAQIEAFSLKEEEFNEEEKEFLELIYQEMKKTSRKVESPTGSPVAKMKQGKTKMKNWVRP
ncbi:MAG: hypothetical protein ACOYK9_05665 [Chlamydiia bacterium]